MDFELTEVSLRSSPKSPHAINLEDVVVDSYDSFEDSLINIDCSSSSSDHVYKTSLRRSSFYSPTKLVIVGIKDMHVVFFLISLGILWALIYWSFSLNNERRTLPSNTKIYATSAWEAVLLVNGTFFCTNNITLPLNLSEYNNTDLTVTISLTFYDIAKCLGWNQTQALGSVAIYLSLVVRWTLTTIIIYYKITDIEKFGGKLLVMKLTTIWVASVFVYVVTRGIGDKMESHSLFVALYCLSIPLVLSRKMLKCLSVEYLINLKWWSGWLICMIVTNMLAAFPTYGGRYVTIVQILFPLILAGLDIFARKTVQLSFNEYRYKTDGVAMLMALYIWRMEVSRFDCFIALFLGWKSGSVPLQDVILNSVFSILGEIWTHSGIREMGGEYLELYTGSTLLKSDFPEIRHIFSSIRAVLEWVIPAITFSILSLLELRRDYVVVPDDNVVIQLLFFTSVRLFQHLFEIILAYYFVEMISLALVWLITKKTGYAPLSILGTIGWHSIVLLGVGVVLLQDVTFTFKFWSALVDIN